MTMCDIESLHITRFIGKTQFLQRVVINIHLYSLYITNVLLYET